MRAVTVREYGGTPAVAEIPTPEPGARQILIRLRAAGMNPMDLWLASGAWKPMPATSPMVLGADGAGVVEKLGEGTSRYSVGDDQWFRYFTGLLELTAGIGVLIPRYAFYAAVALAVVMIGAIIAQLTVLAGSPGAPLALLVFIGVIGYLRKPLELPTAGGKQVRR